MGAVFAPTRFSLVRISARDLVADGKSLVRNSGVGGVGENLILSNEVWIAVTVVAAPMILNRATTTAFPENPFIALTHCSCSCEFRRISLTSTVQNWALLN